MPPRKKPVAKAARVKRAIPDPVIIKDTEPGDNRMKLPATFHEWADKSEVICNLDIHVYTLSEYSNEVTKRLMDIAEKECADIMLLLRKRLKARSKKIGVGCRLT